MGNIPELTCAPSALSRWVEDLYDRIFCQPDDDISASAFNESVAQGFIARINHDQLSRQVFFEAIKKFRLVNVTTVQSIRDIHIWDAPDGSGAGCVVQFGRFKDTNKETGVFTESTTLLVADVQVIDGKRMLFHLTEVLKMS